MPGSLLPATHTCYGIGPAPDQISCSAEEVDVGLKVTRRASLARTLGREGALIPEVRTL